MAIIYAPNEGYNGVSAGVPFVNGKAETKDPYLLGWFKRHGYKVEDEAAGRGNGTGNPEEPDKDKMDNADIFDNMELNELKDYARENDISIGNATSREGILKKIHEAAKEKQ